MTDSERPLLQVNAVPEPAGLTLLGVGAVGLLGSAKLRRRWRK